MTDKPPPSRLRPLWRHSATLHELSPPPPPWPADFLTVRVGDLSEEAICSDKSHDKDDSTSCLPAFAACKQLKVTQKRTKSKQDDRRRCGELLDTSV